jgi:hypothetical protein
MLLTGEPELRNKTLKELKETFQVLKSKLKELDEDAVRDMKWDFSIVNENWLNQVLKGKASLKEKRKLLLTQIGYLRINLFTEYFERVNLLREKNQLDEAVELMNRHAEIARIFISPKKQAAIIKRLKTLFSIRSIDPIECLEQWQTFYKEWVEQASSHQLDEKQRTEKFAQLKTAFLELYTYSFSVDNFPPLRNRRSDH